MINRSNYGKMWMIIGWGLLALGLIVLGLSIWLGWTTLVALIAMSTASFGLLVRLVGAWSENAIKGVQWYRIIPRVTAIMMLFGISPVLLTLAYVLRSTALLQATGVVAGIAVVALAAMKLTLSRVEEIQDMERTMISEEYTGLGEGDNASQGGWGGSDQTELT